jgi:hypothetical protein
VGSRVRPLTDARLAPPQYRRPEDPPDRGGPWLDHGV